MPCIRDTRVTVAAVLGQLAAGRSVSQILDDFPYLEREDIRAALEFATAAVQERELPMASAAFAVENGMTILSADSDFATLLALTGHMSPSLILLRSRDALSPGEQAALVGSNLPAVEDALAQGAVVSLSRQHLRVRRLPVR